MTAIITNAKSMTDTLWRERQPGFGVSLLATAADANGRTLRFVVDYTVKGGHPVDVERMLNKPAARIGIEVIQVECEQNLREGVEDDAAESAWRQQSSLLQPTPLTTLGSSVWLIAGTAYV